MEAMRQPDFYPEHPERVELRQTHTSYVFLAGEYAYKLRKPITLAFIDCSTPARRRELCERELSLNRRLSPEVYCGVLPIIYRNSKYSFGGELTNADVIVDFCLKMHRLPDARRLDQLLESGSATLDDVRRIADHLAQFHANVSSDQAWNYGSAASVWQLVMGNLEEMVNLATDMVMPDQLELIRGFSRRFITAHWEFFNQRARNRRVRDGHGDLRGDAIYLLSDGIRIVDALEFSERLRYADVASEIAFLAMDCDRLGHPEHAVNSRALIRLRPTIPTSKFCSRSINAIAQPSGRRSS
jgi:aminoglycoside phosphotransferase family enzyme